MSVQIIHGDALHLPLADSSVDAIACDPPYGLGFMGRAWDAHDTPAAFAEWCRAWATEALRVLKPGGHLLAFGGTRTWHRLACGIEDAGFEIRDTITWLYGSGFPKSLDVSKAIDRRRDDLAAVHTVCRYVAAARAVAGLTNRDIDRAFGFNGMAGHWTNGQGHQATVPTWDQWLKLRDLIGFGDEMNAEVQRLNGRKGTPGEAWQNAEIVAVDARFNEPSGVVNVGQGARVAVERQIKAPATGDADRWQGWGTALKPASEPIVVARKPLAGTVAQNVLARGTGALNIDACRVGSDVITTHSGGRTGRHRVYGGGSAGQGIPAIEAGSNPHVGRWPSNVVLSHAATPDSEDLCIVCECGTRGPHPETPHCGGAEYDCVEGCPVRELDTQSGTLTSGYMRPGTPRSTRQGDALGTFPAITRTGTHGDTGGASRFFPTFRYQAKAPTDERPRGGDGGAHPTVKPLDLMRWLVRLVTQPGGHVLDPFAGSGTTGEACLIEGFSCTLIEREAEHIELIRKRLSKPIQPTIF